MPPTTVPGPAEPQPESIPVRSTYSTQNHGHLLLAAVSPLKNLIRAPAS